MKNVMKDVNSVMDQEMKKKTIVLNVNQILYF